jgi:hypothetical protein
VITGKSRLRRFFGPQLRFRPAKGATFAGLRRENKGSIS